MSAPILKICPECGSSNIRATGYAGWNVERQNWELTSDFEGEDALVCMNCDEEFYTADEVDPATHVEPDHDEDDEEDGQ
jgi:hypothetical protein